jgi:transcription elongation factor Elf1
MTDDRQPANRGSFSFASPSPSFTFTCPRCSGKHDGKGARKWIKGTDLMACAICVEQLQILRKGKVAA